MPTRIAVNGDGPGRVNTLEADPRPFLESAAAAPGTILAVV